MDMDVMSEDGIHELRDIMTMAMDDEVELTPSVDLTLDQALSEDDDSIITDREPRNDQPQR
jgi:hypothetical protein